MGEARGRSEKDSEKDSRGDGLNLWQILAAAAASTTGAVLANMLGLFGTVAGVALLSVVSSIGTVLYLRSMNRTKDKVRNLVKRPDGAADGVVADRDDANSGELRRPVPPAAEEAPTAANRPAPRVHWRTVAVNSAAVFMLSVATLVGAAWITGQDPTVYLRPPAESQVSPPEPAGEEQDDDYEQPPPASDGQTSRTEEEDPESSTEPSSEPETSEPESTSSSSDPEDEDSSEPGSEDATSDPEAEE